MISSLSFARSRASFDTRPARYRRIKILALCRDLDGKRPYRGRRSPYQLQRGHDEEKLRRPGCRQMLEIESLDDRHAMVDEEDLVAPIGRASCRERVCPYG